MTWWDSLDEYLTELEKADSDAPDPWGAVDLGELGLTEEQVAYLSFDQPGIPRLRGLEPTPGEEDDPASEDSGRPTGNSPGDD